SWASSGTPTAASAASVSTRRRTCPSPTTRWTAGAPRPSAGARRTRTSNALRDNEESREMADFIHPGWSVYIAVVTVVSIIACFLLAMLMSKRRQPGEKVDTTGHVWDGDLRELNNPLPRWWLYLFYITCIFGLGYLVLYPGLGSFQGVLGWSQTGQYDREIEQARARYDPLFEGYLAQDIPTVAADPKAREMGERLFLTYCVQCHGSDARGSRGFPNLADNDWLWGGDPEAIRETIANGRTGIMPPMAAAIGGASVEQVAHYVLSLSGSAHDPV